MVALVITDLHANLVALKSVLSACAGSFEEVWCLGDIVGYGPEPVETLAEVRRLRPVSLAGNHDQGLIGREPLSMFSAGARDALQRHRPLVSEDDVAWLAGLSSSLVHQSVTLVHGSLSDPVWGYIFSPLEAEDTLERARTSLVFTGHTHVPVIWRQQPGGVTEERIEYGRPISLRDGMFVINPGSVGQPRNGNPSAHYALFDTQNRSITFDRVKYPVRRTMRKMRSMGFPESSVSRYAIGR